METISILGCGWLGLPLGVYLVKKGYKVKGSTTEPDKLKLIKEKGIEPYLIVLSPEIYGENYDEFLNCDSLIIDFPPERRDDIIDYHQDQIKSLISAIGSGTVKHIIFTSSTSVYPDINREVYEAPEPKPTKPSGKALMKVENLLRESQKFKTTIIRFGGLIGYDRMPGKFLAGKKDLASGDAPVNLIHRDDCIEIIFRVIKKNIWGETFNACADFHPTRKQYYTEQAELIGQTPPAFSESEACNYKIVSNKKLKKLLNYKFKYPDPSRIVEN
ncbi:MAG: SDR family oxidoreductase [Thermodesulfobacteriota bacterium]